MEPLSWSGEIGLFLNPIMLAAVVVFTAAFVVNIALSLGGMRPGEMAINADHSLSLQRGPVDYSLMTMRYAVLVFLLVCIGHIISGVVLDDPQRTGIIGAMAARLTPVWIGLVVLFALSIAFKRRLGLYGKLFDSPIGMTGFGASAPAERLYEEFGITAEAIARKVKSLL